MYHRDDAAVMASGTPQLHYEEMHTTLEGKQRWLSMSKVPLRDANDTIIGVLGAYEDVTQRKWIDEELLKIQKIESLGLLAGGIAHDFNNILMAIMGNISFAKMMLSPTEEAYARLTVAETASLRAKTLTQQFLTFSSGGAPVKHSFSIAKRIKACGQFALSGAKSTCAYTIADDLWNVDADDNQIGQAMTNVLINADQSMQNGGIIGVVCENVHIGEDNDLPLPRGRFVKIAIKDQGNGIPAKDLNNIFDPYFTTKEAGRGLGLAAAYSIMKKHEGHIAVESSASAGTTFSLYLPAAAAQAEPVTTRKATECIAGKGKILVMDDDEIVLQVVETMLNHLGYHVELAVNGEEALAKYSHAQRLRRPFDAVIMDLLVPGGMGGEVAIRKLLAIDPQARAIVSSGYCYDPVMADYKDYGFKGVIAKPYHLAGLSEQLKQLLHN
jgi:signal transduction histidine kinase/CheY-like chemotaxis protein